MAEHTDPANEIDTTITVIFSIISLAAIIYQHRNVFESFFSKSAAVVLACRELYRILRGTLVSLLPALLLLLIVARTAVTVVSLLDVSIPLPIDGFLWAVYNYTVPEQETHPSHLCSVFIWIIVTCLSVILVLQMHKIKYIADRSLSTCMSCLYLCFIASVIWYEVSMSSYIYKAYAIEIVVGIRLLILLPVSSLLYHSYHQMHLLTYSKPICSHRSDQVDFYTRHVAVNLFFHFVMTIHILSMGIVHVKYAYFSTSEDNNSVNHPKFGWIDIIPAITELIYRCWAIYRYYCSFTRHCACFHNPSQAQSQQSDQICGLADNRMVINDGEEVYNYQFTPVEELAHIAFAFIIAVAEYYSP